MVVALTMLLELSACSKRELDLREKYVLQNRDGRSNLANSKKRYGDKVSEIFFGPIFFLKEVPFP